MSRPKVPAGRPTVQFFSSPHPTPDLDPKPPLLALLAGAKRTLYVGIYSITLPDVAQAIIDAHNRGVTVRMVVDVTEAKGPTSQVPKLQAAGVDLHTWGGSYRLMHMKVAVADEIACAWGSYNFSTQAERGNVEILTTANDRTLAGLLINVVQTAYGAGKALHR